MWNSVRYLSELVGSCLKSANAPIINLCYILTFWPDVLSRSQLKTNVTIEAQTIWQRPPTMLMLFTVDQSNISVQCLVLISFLCFSGTLQMSNFQNFILYMAYSVKATNQYNASYTWQILSFCAFSHWPYIRQKWHSLPHSKACCISPIAVTHVTLDKLRQVIN